MASIRSVLIKTSMGNIQKEISQLEHWLLNLPEDVPSIGGISGSESHTLMRLCSVVEKLAEQLTVQQITLNNIIDRLDVLKDIQEEGNMREKMDEPWLDDAGEPIKNEIIEGDLLEPVYIVTKKSETGATEDDVESVKPPSIHPGIPDEDTIIPDIASVVDEPPVSEPIPDVPVEAELPVVEAKLPVVEAKLPVVEAELPVVEAKKEPVKEEEDVEEEEVEEVEEEVEEEEVEEVEEVEEEEGLELEEIEFKGVRYYKDDDGFIYTIDEEDQPSENPVGVWKEKTQSVAFYKTK